MSSAGGICPRGQMSGSQYRCISKVKSTASKLEYIRVLHVLMYCFAHMVSTAVAYTSNICVFEAKHLLSTNIPTRFCYSRVVLPVY